MAGEAYSKQYVDGFHDQPATDTPVVAAFLNAVETALLVLLGEAPTDGEVQVYDNALGRFKTILLTNAHIDPAAAIEKTKLGALSIVNADIAAGAAIDGSKIAGDIPLSKLLGYPGDKDQVVYGDGTWEKKILAWGTNQNTVTTTGTSFAGGADLLAAALDFTADGTSTYVVSVYAPSWSSTAASAQLVASLNLDGADDGKITNPIQPNANQGMALSAKMTFKPASGAHTVNVRVWAGTAGTVTINAGAGGANTAGPILVTVERL